MERIEAREILKRWATIDAEIRSAEEAYKKKCDEIDMVAMIPSPVQALTGMPHQQTISKNTERVAIRRIEIAEAYRAELERLNLKVIEAMMLRSKVEDALVLCSVMEEQVVFHRYKLKETMAETARKLLISEPTAWRCEQKVLDTICEVYI